MNAEFNWWLLIVGLVVGGALVWLVVADSNRREADLLDEELPVEATWIADSLAEQGDLVDPATVEQVLRLHRAYLAVPPPDEPDPELERQERAALRRRAPRRAEHVEAVPADEAVDDEQSSNAVTPRDVDPSPS